MLTPLVRGRITALSSENEKEYSLKLANENYLFMFCGFI
jgi:hypothetical protein